MSFIRRYLGACLLGALASSASANIYVVDQGNNRIQKLGDNGAYLAQWSGPPQLSGPSGLAMDPQGYLYVADTQNYRIKKFDRNGGYVRSWLTGRKPIAVAADAQYVYFTDGGYQVLKSDHNGNWSPGWGSIGAGNGQFYTATGVATGPSGHVFVVDRDGCRVQKFTSTGTFVTAWGGWGAGNGQFKFPEGIACDAAGNVYVTDTQNYRVQKFDASGVYLMSCGSQGSGPGQFDRPVSITTDASGRILVTDFPNDRVQVFTSSGYYVTAIGSSGSGNGQFNGPFGIVVDTGMQTGIADMLGDPGVRLLASSPNPFRLGTRVSFAMDADGPVGLHVYDVQGRLVRRLMDGVIVTAGEHVASWDGRDDFGSRATPGMYFFHLQAAAYSTSKSVVLLP